TARDAIIHKGITRHTITQVHKGTFGGGVRTPSSIAGAGADENAAPVSFFHGMPGTRMTTYGDRRCRTGIATQAGDGKVTKVPCLDHMHRVQTIVFYQWRKDAWRESDTGRLVVTEQCLGFRITWQ